MNTFMAEVLKKSSAFSKVNASIMLFLMVQDMEDPISFLGSVLTPVLCKHAAQVLHVGSQLLRQFWWHLLHVAFACLLLVFQSHLLPFFTNDSHFIAQYNE